MSEPKDLPEHWKDLIDDYLDGLLDEVRMLELEEHLRSNSAARRYFVRYG
jgi:anti-sigma factor RsiW